MFSTNVLMYYWSDSSSMQGGIVETDPFMIELPFNAVEKDEEICENVKAYSGVKYLHMRRLPQRRGCDIKIFYSFNVCQMIF